MGHCVSFTLHTFAGLLSRDAGDYGYPAAAALAADRTIMLLMCNGKSKASGNPGPAVSFSPSGEEFSQ